MMSRYRKAVAAFITAALALPIADWVGGGAPFSFGTLLAGIVAAAVAAFTVYMTPNAVA